MSSTKMLFGCVVSILVLCELVDAKAIDNGESDFCKDLMDLVKSYYKDKTMDSDKDNTEDEDKKKEKLTDSEGTKLLTWFMPHLEEPDEKLKKSYKQPLERLISSYTEFLSNLFRIF
ncbi:unnamed protein product [Leptidea sinapis]|uniref:Uncharacterized protein n=1 Tax=Leptidea sinapis TaxID=189913 RepID=A0A5E4R2L1_9NEOP|nr:unnamed protein product [Leptidea sinapis]